MDAREAGHEAAKEIQDEHLSELDKRGVTWDLLTEKLFQELEAHETKVFLTKRGKIVYSKPLLLWDIRQKARIDAHKLRGDYPAEKRELTGSNGGPLTIRIVPPGGEEVSVKVDE